MLTEYTVDVIKRTPGGKVVSERQVPIQEYCSSYKRDLVGVLNGIESIMTETYGNNKFEWPQEKYWKFQEMRRTLLNAGNAMERLPYVTRFKGVKIDSIPSDEYMAGVWSKFAKE